MCSSSVRRLMLTAAATALLAGCGPFGYLGKVAKDATRAVADAEKAGAEKYAPYEYWGAVSYLEQAKILMAYSEYERSFDYGTRAKQLAEEAKRKSDRREAGGAEETLEEKPPQPAAPQPAAPQPAAPQPAAPQPAASPANVGGSVGGSVGGGK